MAKKPAKHKGETTTHRPVSPPALITYLPLKPNGSAVIICPGGWYSFENTALESLRIAQALNQQGVTAFVLSYRLLANTGPVDKSVGPLQDAQQTLKLVREKAGVWKLDARRIGLIGFAAGGHLAATAATHFQTAHIPNATSTDLRPDFLLLIYPVISLTEPLAGKDSQNLLVETISFFSSDQPVTSNSSPAWVSQAGDELLVPVGNSLAFRETLIKDKVPAEDSLHSKENHGFVLIKSLDDWMHPLVSWMKKNSWLEQR